MKTRERIRSTISSGMDENVVGIWRVDDPRGRGSVVTI